MAFDEGKLIIRGVDLAYRAYGSPALPPVVLLHALGGDAADWPTLPPDCQTAIGS
jgi:pimeloyl-ACP methyl ester carboxylesterase